MSDLSQLVADASVELSPLHAQEVVSRLQDATFGGDGPGSIYVVSSHHADSDPGPLALSDGFWYLMRTPEEEKTTAIHVEVNESFWTDDVKKTKTDDCQTAALNTWYAV